MEIVNNNKNLQLSFFKTFPGIVRGKSIRYNKVLTPRHRAPSPTSVTDMLSCSETESLKQTLDFAEANETCSLQKTSEQDTSIPDFDAVLTDDDLTVLKTKVFNNVSRDFPLPDLSVASEVQGFDTDLTCDDVDFLNDFFQDGSGDFPYIIE